MLRSVKNFTKSFELGDDRIGGRDPDDEPHTGGTLGRTVERGMDRVAREELARSDVHTVVMGHTHHATTDRSGDVHYFNSGCWTEVPCTYLTVADGLIEIKTHLPEEVSGDAEEWAAEYAV